MKKFKRTAVFMLVTAIVVIGTGIFLLTFPAASSTFLGSVAPVLEPVKIDINADIKPQQPLANPPHPIKALYLTSWSAGGPAAVARVINLIQTTELNAVVVDIKDYTGKISYKPDIAEIVQRGAYEPRIPKINTLIKQLHDAGAYVIARIAVFQDPELVKARPEFALKSKKTGEPWADKKGIHWLDAAAPAVWDYNIAIAKDALQRGFDEVNFDYIRFPTDGDLKDIQYAFYDPLKEQKHEVIRDFLKHVRSELPYAKISVDIFGETVVFGQDSGIGQKFEDSLLYVDAVAPMIYPSHFSTGFLGFKNPAENPKAVISYAMTRAFLLLKKFQLEQLGTMTKKPAGNALPEAKAAELAQPPSFAELRPWLQDFNLGATYDAAKVRAQIDAVNAAARVAVGCKDAALECPGAEIGWMLWNAGSGYNTKGALLPEDNKQ